MDVPSLPPQELDRCVSKQFHGFHSIPHMEESDHNHEAAAAKSPATVDYSGRPTRSTRHDDLLLIAQLTKLPWDLLPVWQTFAVLLDLHPDTLITSSKLGRGT